MSLLLDALKKTEQARPDVVQGTASSPPTPTLTLETLPETPKNKTAREAEDDPARMSAHNLFAAKPMRTGTRLGIVPLALLAGLLFAAGGGYYVWREISPMPMMKDQSPAPSPSFIAITAPPSTAPAPLVVAPEALPVTPGSAPVAPGSQIIAEEEPISTKRAPALVMSAPQASIPKAAKPIRIEHDPKTVKPIHIEHDKDTATVDPTLLAAYQAYRNGDLDTARKHYDEVLHKDTKNRDALLGLGAIAQQQSQDAAAAHYYRQVLALDPRDPIAHAGMSTLFGTADTAGTESRLKLLLAQQPQSAALYFALGNHYTEQSRWSEAQQAYFEAVKRDPDDGRFVFNLAVSLDHLGQSRLAAQYYQRALQLSPADTAGFNRAQVQQRMNELTAP